LWCVADRAGRLEDRPKRIKLEVLPADDCDVDAMLSDLQARGFVVRYEIDGLNLIEICNWSKHQNPHHTEKHSLFPPASNARAVVKSLKQKELSALTVKPPSDNGKCPADSLIPDSLIPDSLKPKPRGEDKAAESSTPAHIDDEKENGKPRENSRAVEIAVRLRRAGIRGANASNPHIFEWSENPKITDDMLDAAADLAKARATNPGPNYLAPIIAQLLNPPPPKRKPDDWHRTDPGIERKARELGITPRTGETYPALKARLFDEIARRERGQGDAA
jgi:hypothetical protein